MDKKFESYNYITDNTGVMQHCRRRFKTKSCNSESRTAIRDKRAIIMGNHNNLKQVRAEAMLSKAELARKADVAVLTITRIEQGTDCRMETKRRIIQALGFKIEDRHKIFPGGF